MRRGVFEALVRDQLDSVLEPRGFTLSCQGAPEWEEAAPSVVYEADPADYARRYPSLRARFDGDVSCIDLWITTDVATGRLCCDLEGDSLVDLLREAGANRLADQLSKEEPRRTAEQQLDAIRDAVALVLDAARDQSG